MAAAALPYQPSRLDEADGVYEPSDTVEERDQTCPLCNGNGDIEGARYDAKTEHAGTVVAYGIGEGLRLSEAWVAGGADAIRDLLADRADDKREIAELRAALEPFARLVPIANGADDDRMVFGGTAVDEDYDYRQITVGDLRRAARLLEKP